MAYVTAIPKEESMEKKIAPREGEIVHGGQERGEDIEDA